MAKITLKAARVNSGLSQAEMAEKLGIDRTTVAKFETGEYPTRMLYVYAYSAVTGFSVDDFLLPNESTN